MLNWDVSRSRARGCKRWSNHGPDVLDLGVAEMDLPIADPILAAVSEATERQAFGYPVDDHLSGVPTATAAWLGRQGLSVTPAGIRLVPDAMRGILLAIRHLTEPSSPVVVPTPSYPRFFEVVAVTGRPCVQVPMRHEAGRYRLDLEGIERALRAGAGSVILCHPANPVGRVFTSDELTELATIVDRHSARVISDEVHAPIRYTEPFTPYAALNETARRHAITVTSATKAWNFPGLRCAMVALTNGRDPAIWDGIRHVEKSGISPLGMIATKAALAEGAPWLTEALTFLDDNRRLVTEFLAGAELPIHADTPEATYFSWLNLTAFDIDQPAAFLLEHAGVATGAGPTYGHGGAGHVRLNFATPQPTLLEALERITTALTKRL
ncbi:aminotransferase class I/II-fold pyridoxal phosphate-dependent enzyme [Actinoallomurus sp. NPDC050550]|uniref:MalY/PatB family protein n=1 Tax=Actinoallomurus sp. NPDC050550 TaxID=3154937 RepID=UPI0033C528AE